MRRSCDDLGHLKLREKCLEIEWSCAQNGSAYKQIYKGLKAFEGLNTAMTTILNVKSQALTNMIAIDETRNSKRNSIKKKC